MPGSISSTRVAVVDRGDTTSALMAITGQEGETDNQQGSK